MTINKQKEDNDTHIWLTLWDSENKKVQYDLFGDDKEVAKFILEIITVLKKEF
jgi:hypothetical protein